MIIRGKTRPHPAIRRLGPDYVSAQSVAQEIARAKYLAHYFELECGHLGTIDEDTIYKHWRPKKYLHWCDYDGWVRLAPKKEKSPDTNIPLF